jgi:hypothetical protein
MQGLVFRLSRSTKALYIKTFRAPANPSLRVRAAELRFARSFVLVRLRNFGWVRGFSRRLPKHRRSFPPGGISFGANPIARKALRLPNLYAFAEAWSSHYLIRFTTLCWIARANLG